MVHTTEAIVRNEYFFLRNEENVVGNSKSINGDDLTLKERAYAIVEIKKDGNVLVEGGGDDFTFQEPDLITFAVTPTSANVYNIVYDTNLDSSQISAHVTKAESFINSRLNQAFPDNVPFTTSDPLLQEIATLLAGATALRSMLFKNHSIKGDPQKLAKMLFDEGMGLLKDVDEGELDLLNFTRSDKAGIRVGNKGEFLFKQLDEIEDVDYFGTYRQPTAAERGVSSPRNFGGV